MQTEAFIGASAPAGAASGVRFGGFCGKQCNLQPRSPLLRTGAESRRQDVQHRRSFSFSYDGQRSWDVFAIVASERPMTMSPSLTPRLGRSELQEDYVNVLRDIDLSGRPRTINNGYPHTDESKAKISAANKGKTPWNKGRKHSEETKMRIAEATRAAMQRPDMIARMRLNQLGKKHSVETRAKIKERLHDPDVQAKIEAARVKRYGLPEERERMRAERQQRRRAEVEVRLRLAKETQRAGEEAMTAGLASAVPLLVPPSSSSGVYGSFPRRLDANRLIALERRLSVAAGVATPRPRSTSRMSEETRAKLRESIRARWQDPEYRARHAAGMAGKGVGRKLSEEHKAKIRETLLRKSAISHGMDPDEAVLRGTAVPTRSRRRPARLPVRRPSAGEAGVTALGGTAHLASRRYESGSGSASDDGHVSSTRGPPVSFNGSRSGAGGMLLTGLFGNLCAPEQEREAPAARPPSPAPAPAPAIPTEESSAEAPTAAAAGVERKARGRPRKSPLDEKEALDVDEADLVLDDLDDDEVAAPPHRKRAAAADDELEDAWADDEEEEEERPVAPVKRRAATRGPSKRRSKGEGEMVYRKVYKNGRLVEVQAVPAEKKNAFWYLRHSQSYW